jgi:plasmid stabilization system protein ParE
MTRRFRRQALSDIREAAAWYEEQKPGLGDSFLAGLEETLIRIENNPKHYPRVLGVIRRARFAKPFPHLVFYRDRGETLEIIAVFHPARDPATWRGR